MVYVFLRSGWLATLLSIFSLVSILSFSSYGARYIVTFKEKGSFESVKARTLLNNKHKLSVMVQGEIPIKDSIKNSRKTSMNFMGTSVQVIEILDELDIVLIDTENEQALEALKANSHVVIEEDVMIPTPAPLYNYEEYISLRNSMETTDKQKQNKQKILNSFNIERPWGLDAIGTPNAWKITRGQGATVLILDSGIDKDHREVKDSFLMGKNFVVSQRKDLPYDFFDETGHGTHTSGTVAGALVGVAPEAKILMAKVCNDGCLTSNVLNGINWGLANGADVINFSLGGRWPSSSRQKVMKEATKRGVVIVAASGNSAEPADFADNPWMIYPAANDFVIAVGALNRENTRADFSQYSEGLSVVAPGVSIQSCGPGMTYYGHVSINLGDRTLEAVPNTLAHGASIIKDETLSAPIIFAGLGNKEDFEKLDLKGHWALVHRGEITFLEKVNHATEAGALGVIIVNNKPGLIRPWLKDVGETPVSVPVFLVEQEVGSILLESLNAGTVPTISMSMELGPSYLLADGTSMSSPHVAGLAALIKSVSPNFTSKQVQEIIESTTTPIEPTLEYGHGLIHAEKAVKKAVEMTMNADTIRKSEMSWVESPSWAETTEAALPIAN